jgi:ribosomal protein S27E
LALFVFLLLFWSLLAPVVGQNPAGHVAVATDYELYGTSDLRGGGHVAWTFTGGKAAELRAKIIHLFDEYDIIPRGFVFADRATSANHNRRLDSTEGARYTDVLENWLEAKGSGTDAQYLQMYPFDLRDKTADVAASFNRSTSGLAATDVNATGDVQIRFLFEANITRTDARFPLATRVLASAPYEVFSFRAAQSANLTRVGAYPPTWPFLLEGGWHVVTAFGYPAFWAGNDTTGRYDNNTDASTSTSVDPVLASVNPAYVPFDLRFASQAWATFNYTGSVAVGDSLHLEYAHPPGYTDWTPLRFGVGTNLTSTAPGAWSNVTVDLNGLLGERVKLRFHFHSDGTISGPGFFIRNFAIHAPSSYEGEVVESDTHYLVGTLSFSDPAVSRGGIHLIRTPGGDILVYGSTWDTSALPPDRMHFQTFDVTENPQILFGVMLVATYAISRLQDSAYDRFREAHPSVYRPAVHKAKWLHRVGKAAMAVLVLFYFVPTATWVIGLRVFVSGIYYWFLAVTLAAVVGLGTRAYYRRNLVEAPPPTVGEEEPVVRKVLVGSATPGEMPAVAACTHCLREIREDDKTYRCTCGAVYHVGCATTLMQCSNCRRPIALEAGPTPKQVSLRCESCGELQTVFGGSDPRAMTCAACGGPLRHLDPGRRYLIVTSNPGIAFAWMRDLSKNEKPSVCMTTASPDRIRLEYDVNNMSIVQVSARARGALDPKKLDPAGLKAILPLAREGKGGAILYDSLDQMVSESSLGDMIRFLRKANDMAFVHGATVIARVSPGQLADQELSRLNAEFDEYIDLSGQL